MDALVGCSAARHREEYNFPAALRIVDEIVEPLDQAQAPEPMTDPTDNLMPRP
jgi:hypothetical protein